MAGSAKNSVVNTRMMERFRSSNRVSLLITPLGSDVSIQAEMIDVNEYGGLGVFVPDHTGLEPLTLMTFLGGWKVQRQSKKGKIDFTVRIFSAVPTVHNEKSGVRFSAMPMSRKHDPDASKFFISTRRRAKRSASGPQQATLQRRGTRMRGRVMNVGDDDGMGLDLDPKDVPLVKWGEIFSEGWQMEVQSYKITCIMQRLGYHDGRISLGIVAPGVTRLLGGGSNAAAIEATKGDSALLNLLDSVMKKRK